MAQRKRLSKKRKASRRVKYKGRKPSGKNKNSKVRKLIRLAKQRARSKKKRR